eukprot:747034-Hanusia_phi.AAC.6
MQTRGHVLSDVTPNKATQAYVDFVMEIARRESKKISLICASLTPCMRLYAWLGSRLAKANFGEALFEVSRHNRADSDSLGRSNDLRSTGWLQGTFHPRKTSMWSGSKHIAVR